MINLKELAEKNSEVADRKINCKKIVKGLFYWMCIKFFRSRTTDIYSLTLTSPSRLRQTYYLTKKKRLSKNKLLKDYNRIVRILVEFGLPSFFLTSSATPHRPITKTSGSASSRNIPSGPSAALYRPIPSLYIIVVSPKSTIFPLLKSSSLTRVKKRCQHSLLEH